MSLLTERTIQLRAGSTTVTLGFPDAEDHIAARIFERRRFYEEDLLTDLISRAKPGRIVDVGAHMGNHTIFCAAHGRPVTALEPNPSSRAALEANVARNQLNSLVTIIPAAAGARPGRGRVEMFADRNSGMTRVISEDDGETQVIPLDSLELDDVAAVKIDVEDGELAVLAGVAETLRRCQPIVYVEAATPERLALVEEFMAGLGYRRFGQYARTPTYGYAPLPDAAVSVAIMAHPKRQPFVEELLGWLDTEPAVVWDRNDNRWDTGRRALLARDPAATHHLVVQDDALICKDFVAGATQAVMARPHAAISFYCGRQRPHAPLFDRLFREARRKDVAWLHKAQLCWGVALCFPTSVIDEMVAVADRDVIPNYDSRLSRYLDWANILTCYTNPSLADHRRQAESPSLVPGRTGANRIARGFIGQDVSALTVDWSRPYLNAPDPRTQTLAAKCRTCGQRADQCR